MSAPFVPDAAVIRIATPGNPEDMCAVEAFLADRDDSTPFHRPAWLRAVNEGCGQASHYLLAERAGRICGLLPLTEMRSMLFGKALASSGFAVDGGILTDDSATRKALAAMAITRARDGGFPSVELRGGSLPNGGSWHIDENTYSGFVSAIEPDTDAQLKAVPRKQRAEIRKALNGDLVVHIGRGRRERAWHYAVYAESVRNLGTPVFPAKLFEAVLDGFGDDADILTVLDEGTPVASVLSLYHRGAVMPYWGGGLHAARALRANELMYFRLMDHARERGCTAFDFGRSKTGTGPWSYKKNWGFEPRPLRYAGWSAEGGRRDLNPDSPKYRLMVNAWRKLPLSVANMIGPWLSRGLG